jgi:molybdopterin/thiamine biosynthesis adenylyltransferase
MYQAGGSLKSVVVIGAGGNIGSHLAPHLARMREVGRVTLIDRDTYEAANLTTQDITPRDVGRSKASVQARRLRRINPQLRIAAFSCPVESLQLGLLRCDVILACLDSRRARQYVNQAAWRLGVPWIDSGVEAGGLLARVNVYVPATHAPCLECAWDERDYRGLEQIYPCLGDAQAVAPTNAPSSLGALAASLQAIECRKLLAGRLDLAAVSRQVLVDGAHLKHYVTAYRRNPRCLLADHEPWAIDRLTAKPRDLTLAQALALGPGKTVSNSSASFRLEGRLFAKRLTCTSCGQMRDWLRLIDSSGRASIACAGCGGAMAASGFDTVERLHAADLTERQLGKRLSSLGVRQADVFSVGYGEALAHFEIGCDAACDLSI